MKTQESERVAAEIQSRHLAHDISVSRFCYFVSRQSPGSVFFGINCKPTQDSFKMNGGNVFFSPARKSQDLMGYFTSVSEPIR